MNMQGVCPSALGQEAMPVIVQGSSTAAVHSNNLGVGYSGSGFLLFYFVGVTSVLKHLGIISNTTRLAGSSGGAAVAAATCAGLDPMQQYTFLQGMADHCRPSGGCRGFLGTVVSQQLHSVLPPDAPRLCSGRLFIAVTAAKPHGQPDPHMLLGSTWASKDHLVSAVSASCYLPALSGPTATTQLHGEPEAGAVYDGGFSHRLPCPPGVDACIRVAAQAPVPGSDPAQDLADFINLLSAGLANATTAADADNHTAPFLPLNPKVKFPDSVDIYPGLSGPLRMPAQSWNNLALAVPDAATLQYLFDAGRQDAAHWVTQQQLAQPRQIRRALLDTAVSA